eukprot:3942654-Pleurochrysis_carterae.AAC.1
MGMLEIDKDNPMSFDGNPSHNIVPLRPSRVLYTVSQVNIKHYWLYKQWPRVGAPIYLGHDMIGSVGWHCLCLSQALWNRWLRICRLSQRILI